MFYVKKPPIKKIDGFKSIISFFYPLSASAPLTISRISLVMDA